MQLLNSLMALENKPVSFEELSKWHKEKKYPVSPVALTLTKDGLQVNDEELVSVVDSMELIVSKGINGVTSSEGIEEVEPLGVDALAELKKQVSMIHGWFVNPRIEQTKPFDEIKKKCTTQEGRIKAFGPLIQMQIDSLNEAEYAAVETILFKYINMRVEESGYAPAMSSFDGLLAKKRKTNCITKSDEPNSAVRKEIDALIAEVIAPIKAAEEAAAEATRLKDEENRQHALFADSLDSKEDIPSLEKLKGDLGLMFPAIKDFAETRIDSKIAMIEAREAKSAKFKDSLNGLSEAIAAAPRAIEQPVEGGVTDEQLVLQFSSGLVEWVSKNKPVLLSGDPAEVVSWMVKQIRGIDGKVTERFEG